MTNPLLQLKNVSKKFQKGNQFFHAVQSVSFNIFKGQTVGLGGESGCGKSTLAKLIMQLLKPTSGEILFHGKSIHNLNSAETVQLQKKMQMIFQQPASSLNPKMSVRKIISEPLEIHGLYEKQEREDYLYELLQQVGLNTSLLNRFPCQLSGGQKQRVAIARALAIHPDLLICDEPFSALDVSTQVQIIKLLSQLQTDRALSYLIISHDLSILRYLSHRLAIMYLGHLVEWGETESVYVNPLHPYSQGLVSSVLEVDLEKKKERSRVVIKGEIPTSMAISKGCPFSKRCPIAKGICEISSPELREIKPGHFAACHFA